MANPTFTEYNPYQRVSRYEHPSHVWLNLPLLTIILIQGYPGMTTHPMRRYHYFYLPLSSQREFKGQPEQQGPKARLEVRSPVLSPIQAVSDRHVLYPAAECRPAQASVPRTASTRQPPRADSSSTSRLRPAIQRASNARISARTKAGSISSAW
jgi:hypothetical protein